jgi:hypothetical protein
MTLDRLCDHLRGVDEDRKRLKHAYKDQQKQAARRAMLLDEPSLNDLLDRLDVRLQDVPCDHTLRLTRAWADERGLDQDAVAASVAEFGGYCDCEVLANVDPEAIY